MSNSARAKAQQELDQCLTRTGVKRLRKKHRGAELVIPFPDLSCASVPRPSVSTPYNTKKIGCVSSPVLGAKSFPVGHLHKQGLQLITHDAMKSELQYYGGKKA